MKVKLFVIALVVLVQLTTQAQKKVTPVSQSAITGVALPSGSTRDSRLLSEMAAQELLELESRKTNTTVSRTEVLYLPLTESNAWPNVLTQLTGTGWMVTPLDDPKYHWLQKNGRYVLSYFSIESKEQNLYFGEVAGTPSTFDGRSQLTVQPVEPQRESRVEKLAVKSEVKNADMQAPRFAGNSSAANGGYAFSVTNFDDGWTSTVQEDWVEVNRPGIKVLLHYPKEGTVFPADPEPLTNAAWNILVAPRYKNLREYRTAYISTYDRPYLGMGIAVENATNREVFILFFRQGNSGWIEIITANKNVFINHFGFDPYAVQWDTESALLNPLTKLPGYNRFALSPQDLRGKWTSDFTGIQQLYNVYTGASAGMHMNQSNETFEFGQGNSYTWKLLVVTSTNGIGNYANVGSKGTFSVPNNWQVKFPDIEGKPKLYDAYFSVIKGARILWMNDANAPGSGIFKGFALAK
jgi:hypothetical protein